MEFKKFVYCKSSIYRSYIPCKIRKISISFIGILLLLVVKKMLGSKGRWNLRNLFIVKLGYLGVIFQHNKKD